MSTISRDELSNEGVRQFFDSCEAFVNSSMQVFWAAQPGICDYSITKHNGVRLCVQRPGLVGEFEKVIEKFLTPNTLGTEKRGSDTIFTFRIQRG